jgi:phosphoserine phosphatase
MAGSGGTRWLLRPAHFSRQMTHVATLIADPAQPMRDDVWLQAARNLPAARAPVWLEPGLALDLPFTPSGGSDNRATAEAVRAALGARIDVVVQQAAGRRKRMLLADMDSTMIGQECVDELADFIGQKARVAAITERAMRGEIEFAPALRERVALLAGLPASAVEEVMAKRITLTPGGRTLVKTMRRHGAYTCLVSGGFTVFTARIAVLIGFDENRGNRLVIGDDGRFLGQVAEPVLGRDAKLETLRELRRKLGLARDDTLVVGDGANDLKMIGDAGLGVAFHAKPLVAEAAAARIDYGDLTALLYAQGYRREEFAEA